MVVLESMGYEKVCTKGCSPPHNTQRCVTSAESSVRKSLTSTRGIMCVIHGDYYMTVEIHGTCTYNSFTKLIHVSLYVS